MQAERVVEPHAIRIPDALTAEIDRLVELVSRRTGEHTDHARVYVEAAVVERGIEALKVEEGAR